MYKQFPLYTKKEALGDYFGNNLLSAVKEFQKRTGLKVNGHIDESMLKKLESFGFKY
jgi:murein L,D-transpeptidase YcbB/YkuD